MARQLPLSEFTLGSHTCCSARVTLGGWRRRRNSRRCCRSETYCAALWRLAMLTLPRALISYGEPGMWEAWTAIVCSERGGRRRISRGWLPVRARGVAVMAGLVAAMAAGLATAMAAGLVAAMAACLAAGAM